MATIVSKRGGAVLALAAGLFLGAALPAFSQDAPPPPPPGQGPGFPPPQGPGVPPPPHHFRFDGDERGNVEGKRASCEVYARIAQIQAEANRKYRCGFEGPAWDFNAQAHFQWCRHVRRDTISNAARERFAQLQRCFDRLGDFDDDSWEH